jgi:hypothetical protein
MAGAAFSGLLVHTAVVFRRQSGLPGDVKRDRLGQPSRDEQELARYPCRVTNARGGRQFGERMQDVFTTTHELFLERGADIREDDVVTVLAAPMGSAELGVTRVIVERATVQLVRPVVDGVGDHHTEVQLSSQRGVADDSWKGSS